MNIKPLLNSNSDSDIAIRGAPGAWTDSRKTLRHMQMQVAACAPFQTNGYAWPGRAMEFVELLCGALLPHLRSEISLIATK